MSWAQGHYLTKAANAAEVRNLISEIQSFCTVLSSALDTPNERGFPLYCTALCVAQSAIFQILDPLTCPEKLRPGAGYATSADAKTSVELSLQAYASATIQETCTQVRDFCSRLTSPLTSRSDDLPLLISPFMLHVVYNTIATLHWYVGESGSLVHQASVSELLAFMEQVRQRWRIASEYLGLGALWDVTETNRAN